MNVTIASLNQTIDAIETKKANTYKKTAFENKNEYLYNNTEIIALIVTIIKLPDNTPI
jgi:hypothetical protein